ncbi:hypothetical protein FBU30_004684 [Linnemannia zychae]|nr:hypothetical protein FBU30_004684 [Linnemannia zychae]
MASTDNGTDLAQKYKDKVLARKRGAGTHQPKFRGFSIGKTSNKETTAQSTITNITSNNSSNYNIDTSKRTISRSSRGTKISASITTASTSTATTTATTTKSIIAASTTKARVEGTGSKTQLTTTQPSESRGFLEKRVASGESSGLTARYQERLRTRFRGAGAHKPDFKGFSLKDIKSSRPSEQNDGSELPTIDYGSENASRAPIDKAPRKSKATEILKSSTTLSTSANNSRRSPITKDSTPTLKDMLAQPSTTIQLTPNSSRTRAASRYTGQSPSFKLAWGKTLIVSQSRKQEAALARTSREATPITPKPVITPGAVSTEEIDEQGDLNNINDFYTSDVSPSPTRNNYTVEPAPIKNTTISTSKRKTTSTTSSETLNATAHKPAIVPTKRRRLIQEEVDENEEPLPSPEDHTKSGTKSTTNGRMAKSTALSKENTHDKAAKTITVPATKISAIRSDHTSKELSTKKSGVSEVKISKSVSSAKSSMPLKQTTLVQLNSKIDGKESGGSSMSLAARDRVVANDDTGSDDDFVDATIQKPASKLKRRHQNVSKNTVSKNGKGPSDDTVKNYKQLQIHCLKFWGPTAAVAKPATVRSKKLAQKLPIEGSEGDAATATAPPPEKKSVQSILHIDSAPLSEMDVIADAVRDVIENYIDSVDDESIAGVLIALRTELETRLIEQVDMLDDYSLLRASVKKAAAVKKELRMQLLETQRRRQKTRLELAKVRAGFEREESARMCLEETHKFLTDLESLRDEIIGSDNDDENNDSTRDQTKKMDQDNNKTGLQSYIATVGARSGGAGPRDDKDTGPGMLGALVEFNQLLETMIKNTSDTAKTTNVIVSGSDSDSSNYDL